MNREVNVYVCTDHDSHYPVGCASVVVASCVEEARRLLDVELLSTGLKGYNDSPYTLTIVDQGKSHCLILNDGNY